jgi:hypothetical protein
MFILYTYHNIVIFFFFNSVYKIPQCCTGYEISVFEIMQQDIAWTKIVGCIQFFESTYSGSTCKYVSFTVTDAYSDVIYNHSGA